MTCRPLRSRRSDRHDRRRALGAEWRAGPPSCAAQSMSCWSPYLYLLPVVTARRSSTRPTSASPASSPTRSSSTSSSASASTSWSAWPACSTSATSASTPSARTPPRCSARRHASCPWLATFPVAIAVSMLAGVILGTPTLRLRGDYLAIVTLGFGEIIRIIGQEHRLARRAPRHHRHPPPAEHRSLGISSSACSMPKPYYWLGLTVDHPRRASSCAARAQPGRRAWTAIREDEDAAELMGVPTFKFKLWAFAIGAAIGGLAGASVRQQGRASSTPTTSRSSCRSSSSPRWCSAAAGNIAGAIVGAVARRRTCPERFRSFSETSGTSCSASCSSS